MAIFYYCKSAKLHLCSKTLGCTEEDYEKLKEKGKITKEHIEMLFLLQKYRALTDTMLSDLMGADKKHVHQELEKLSEYGLVIKQFYEGERFETNARTETFYCAGLHLPKETVNENKMNDFTWSREIKIEDIMAILSFNQFHIALTSYVPKKALQAQTCYNVRHVCVDGRYRLKSSKFQLGYSHLFVISVRDFAERNVQLTEKLKAIKEYYSYSAEKMPWFVLLCENRNQCCRLNKRIHENPDLSDVLVYYLLDTDIAKGENPLYVLQTYHFANKEQEIESKIFCVKDWY